MGPSQSNRRVSSHLSEAPTHTFFQRPPGIVPSTDRSAYAHAGLPRRVPRLYTSDLNIDRLISRPYTSDLNVDISRSAPPSSTLLSDSPSIGHDNAPMEALLEEYSHLVYVESLPEPPSVPSLLPLSPVQPVDTNVPPSTDNDT